VGLKSRERYAGENRFEKRERKRKISQGGTLEKTIMAFVVCGRGYGKGKKGLETPSIIRSSSQKKKNENMIH